MSFVPAPFVSWRSAWNRLAEVEPGTEIWRRRRDYLRRKMNREGVVHSQGSHLIQTAVRRYWKYNPPCSS